MHGFAFQMPAAYWRDHERPELPPGALAGVPFVAKDNIATTHLQTTCGSSNTTAADIGPASGATR